MRMHKEQIWLGMAFLSFLFLFERSDTLIVQDGQVCVNQRIHYEREDKQHMCNYLAELSSTLGIAKSGSVVSSIKAKSHQSHTSTTRNNQRVDCKKCSGWIVRSNKAKR